MLFVMLWILTGQAIAADEAVTPLQPSDPVAAKAFGVFDQACAGCHQTGKLKSGRVPAGNLGNILDLTALVRNPSLVTPGNADASPLYNAMQSRAMPLDVNGDAPAPEITSIELAAVRDWIEQLPVLNGCIDHPRVTAHAVADTVSTFVKALPAARAAKTRFASLVPMHNACATVDEIEGARQALALLMNSLSIALEPAKLRAVDAAGLILEINLDAIGWTKMTWERLAQRAPAAPFTVFDATTRAATGTDMPMVNGDWLVDAATRAPLYYELLGLPDQLSSLLSSLRIDPTDLKRGTVDRIGIRTSQVARGNRLIERRTFANGAAWQSSEFAPTAARPDMFDMTIAAAIGARPPLQMQADATLLHFDLPNGFPAYFAANPSGMRVNDLPLSVLKDDTHPSSKVGAVQSCAGCHAATPVMIARSRTDDLKARIAGEPNIAKDVRDRLLALHPETADLQRKIDEDRARFLRVAGVAGVEPLRQVGGLDLLPALIARYRRDVTLSEIADLVDVEPSVLLSSRKSGSAALVDLIERLPFGAVSRAEVDAILPELAVRRGLSQLAPNATAVPVSGASTEVPGALMRLVLKVDRPEFQAGDLLTLSARTNASCYLTLLTINAQGRGTVLFPNEFEPNNFIEAGHETRVPGDKAPYQFRLRDKGQETLIGVCATTAKSVDGIRHDFEKQRFTELGDYRAFLNRNWGQREPSDGKTKPKVARRVGDATVPPIPTDAALKLDTQARTAIRIMVE